MPATPVDAAPGSAAALYLHRLDAAAARAAAAQAAESRLAWAKIAAVLLTLALAWAAIIAQRLSAAWLLPALAVLVVLFLAHGRAIAARERLERTTRFYRRGLDRLHSRPGHPTEEAPTGARFRDPQHVYADDLDLFGPGSIFQLLSLARTPMGEECLAGWLRAPAPAAEIRRRQNRVAALQPELDLREQVSLLGDDLKLRLDPARLALWAAGACRFRSLGLRLLFAWIALATVVAVVYSLGGGGLGWVAALVALQIVLSLAQARAVHAAVSEIGANDEGLSTFAAVLAASGDPTGAAALRRLARLSEWTSATGSALGRMLDFTLLYSLQLAFVADAWRARHGAALTEWLRQVGEFEALLSLSNHAYEHPDDVFAEILDAADPVYHAQALGHPLIPEADCIRNDVRLDSSCRMWLVSGSNMSGKSTLLRSIGVNAVLALAGAPVRAHSLRLTPLALGTRLRTSDSLQQGRSGYYAEILRLRQVFELTRGALPVLFLFDELMEGTNSHDRVVGSAGLLRSLLARNALGLVTTHDLALAAIAGDLGAPVRNVHFEDQIEGQDVKFDHRLRDGVVTRSNALALMRIIGLEV